MTPRTQKGLLKKLSGWGPERAIAAIEHSIAMGWEGVFEEKKSQPGAQYQRPGVDYEEFKSRTV